MNLQEIYNTAKARIERTGRCVVGTSCRYRNEDGAACAVGALIPDEFYNRAMEGAVVAQLVVDHGKWEAASPMHGDAEALARALNGAGVPASYETRAFLMSLQEAHDAARTTKTALRRMAEAAKDRGLVP